MSDEDIISAIRRKAGIGRPPPDVLPLTPEKALRLSAAKAAQDGLEMQLLVTKVEELRSATTMLEKEVPENGLISLLQGPGNAYGLAIFDVPSFSAVVEQQTAGRVLSLTPENRPPTSTDAMMCAALIDDTLKLFETELASLPTAPQIEGYRVAAQLHEARSITLAFEDMPYRVYRLSVALGKDGREGAMTLAFPLAPPKPREDEAGGNAWEDQFQDVVMRSEACLDSVLHRINMTVAEVMALQEGDVLTLPAKAVSQIEVLAGEHFVTKARLGQFNGARALRLVLNEAPDTDDALALEGAGLGDTPMGLEMDMGGDFPDLNGGGDAGGLGDLPALGDLPDMNAGTDLPDLDMAGDLPALDDMPEMGELPPLGDLPDLGGDADMAGDLPDLGELPDMGDLPDLGELPPLDAGEALPPLGELPPLGDLPTID